MKIGRRRRLHLRDEDLTVEVLQRARFEAARTAKLFGQEAFWLVERMEEIWARRGPQRERSMLARIDAILAEASPVRMDIPPDPERPADHRSRRKGRS